MSLIFVSTHLPFFLRFSLSMDTFLTLFFYVTLSLCLTAFMSLNLSASRSLCLSASSSLCFSVSSSLCLSVCHWLSMSFIFLSLSVSLPLSVYISCFYLLVILSVFSLCLSLSAFYSEQHPSCFESDLMLQQFSVFDHKVEQNKKKQQNLHTICQHR